MEAGKCVRHGRIDNNIDKMKREKRSGVAAVQFARIPTIMKPVTAQHLQPEELSQDTNQREIVASTTVQSQHKTQVVQKEERVSARASELEPRAACNGDVD